MTLRGQGGLEALRGGFGGGGTWRRRGDTRDQGERGPYCDGTHCTAIYSTTII